MRFYKNKTTNERKILSDAGFQLGTIVFDKECKKWKIKSTITTIDKQFDTPEQAQEYIKNFGFG